jgi:hypothetical protein
VVRTLGTARSGNSCSTRSRARATNYIDRSADSLGPLLGHEAWSRGPAHGGRKGPNQFESHGLRRTARSCSTCRWAAAPSGGVTGHQTRLCNRRPRDVATRRLQSLATPRRHPRAGVQREPVQRRGAGGDRRLPARRDAGLRPRRQRARSRQPGGVRHRRQGPRRRRRDLPQQGRRLRRPRLHAVEGRRPRLPSHAQRPPRRPAPHGAAASSPARAGGVRPCRCARRLRGTQHHRGARSPADIPTITAQDRTHLTRRATRAATFPPA